MAEFKHWSDGIREVGPQNVLISSDLGQRGRMIHADGYRIVFERLKKAGFTQAGDRHDDQAQSGALPWAGTLVDIGRACAAAGALSALEQFEQHDSRRPGSQPSRPLSMCSTRRGEL
jgi:hypothetical protein